MVNDYELIIPSLSLPRTKPSPEALKSWGQTDQMYTPKLWEITYPFYRYLGSLSDERLIDRYKGVVKNLLIFVSPERDVIPINSFLSSWYWFRKEHTTRLELHLRELVVPDSSPSKPSIKENIDLPYRPKHPNSGDVLYRFMASEYAKIFVEKGNVRLTPARNFDDENHNLARRDNELQIDSYLLGKHTKITTQDGVELPIIGDVKRSSYSPDYYLMCTSCGFHPELFNDFSSDNCVVIFDVPEFKKRIENEASKHLLEWSYFDGPVEYFDPYEKASNNPLFMAGLCKDFSFAYQMEWRFQWSSLKGAPTSGYINLSLGSLSDIAVLIYRSTV